jgi:hypothetical protein
MFGTLVIILECGFEGGQLVVNHNGEQKEFDFAKDCINYPYFIAFYADCEHGIFLFFFACFILLI